MAAIVLVVMPSWLLDAWKDYLGHWLALLWSAPIWQPLTLLLLTAGSAAYKWRRPLARRVLGDDDRSRDITLFLKLDAMASESFVGQVLNDEVFLLFVSMERLFQLWDFLRELERIGNRYLDQAVQKRAENLAGELRKLRLIMGRTFWKVDEDRIKFYPDSIDPEVYDREHAELNAQIGAAWETYKAYRTAVMDRLRI